MKRVLLVAVFFAVAVFCAAQYPALLIPDSLKKESNTVIRLSEVIYEIKSPGKAKMRRHEVKTILNEEGVAHGIVGDAYDKFDAINYIDAKLYDSYGKEVKKVKTKDMADESGSSDETLMTDRRYKVYDFGYRSYPYTVDIEEEEDIDGIRTIYPWVPQRSAGVSVEASRFVVIAPSDYVLRYKAFNYPGQPVITDQSGKKTYTWEIKNLPAKTSENYAPSWRELVTGVLVEPSQFEAEGYRGDMSTWADFGKFINSLLAGKNVLPDAVKQKVHQLADNISDPREKIKVLYNYLQQNTRYISIQFGIGGWQPFDAAYVYNKRYGDCKALSNYMVAILREAGIKAYYVLISAGQDEPPLIADFPSSQFNHATVCVPLSKDTMWLECTNQTLPAGYIGWFTGNRQALLIDENGGHVVNTKTYSSKDNTEVTRLTGEIDETGKLTANISTTYAGFSYYSIHSRANELSKEEQLKRLKEEINLATYDVPSFAYEDHKSENPCIDEKVQVVADGGATVSGKRLFFTPNFLSQTGVRLQASENRKYDVVYRNDFVYIDTLQYTLPQGYTVEAMAKDVNINNKFGVYEIHFNVSADKLTVTRKYERNSARYPPSEYNNLVKFYDDMYKADRSKIVFVKKDS